MQKKQILFFGLMIVLLTAVVSATISWGRHKSAATTDKVKVVASFYPMAEFARQVGGDRVEVTTMVKPGVEPHDYDPSPQDMSSLYHAKLFVYNGAGLERWADRLRADLARSNVQVVQASDGLKLLSPQASEGSEKSTTDPHVWLNPVLAQKEVGNIAAALVQADPAHASEYQARAAAYTTQLATLDQAYRTHLAQCSQREIVTTHQAMQYVANEYTLTPLAISGLSPDDEPSPQKLSEISNVISAHHIHYIFLETLASPRLADTVANETGAQTLVFNPLEGLTDQEQAAGKSYLSVQYDNLQNLRLALDCK